MELIVVIGIIGLILAAASTSYSAVQKKARDSKRKSDLKNISSALEQYYSVCGFIYPSPDAAPDPDKVPTAIACASPATTIMSTVPTDPSTGARYNMSGAGTTYSICAPNTPPLESETVGTYCLTNQQ